MGRTAWSDEFHAERVVQRAKTGQDAFAHHVATSRMNPHERKVHASLDPNGVRVREARDSSAHPESLPIGILLDVTGSMEKFPRKVQAELPKLMGTITDTTGIQDQQILFGAIGDATKGDRGPLQVGQFESGIEMDNDISNFWLEGMGGGGGEESYQLGMYFFARHTATDCWEKRQKKGYLFLLGDEKPYPTVSKEEVQALIGDGLEADISTEEIVAELKERWNVFFLFPQDTYGIRTYPDVRPVWGALLGPENVIDVDDEQAVCETIALVVSLGEGHGLPETASSRVTRRLQALAQSLGTEIPVAENVRL
jgi:hypothetical protein